MTTVSVLHTRRLYCHVNFPGNARNFPLFPVHSFPMGYLYLKNIGSKLWLFLTNAIKVHRPFFVSFSAFHHFLEFVLFFTSPWVQFPTSLKSRLFITPRSTLNACLYHTMPTYEGIQKYLTLQHTRPSYLARPATGKSCAGKINNSDKAIWYRMQFWLCASQERER